jgi:hypothetical protein
VARIYAENRHRKQGIGLLMDLLKSKYESQSSAHKT